MSKGTLRLGLIGCGPRGHEHVKAALATEQFEFSAVADLDAKRLGDLSEKYNPKKRYGDFNEMLSKEAPFDVVHLCTQPTLRKKAIIAALAAKAKAIVIEKPMALDYTEAATLVKLCQDGGALLVVNHQKRNMIEWTTLRETVTSGKLGDVKMLRSSCYGNLLNQGTHMLDMAWNVLGEPKPLWLLAGADSRVNEYPTHPAPRNTLVLMAYDNGVRANFAIGADAPEVPNSRCEWFWCNVEVRGTLGRAESVLDQGFKRWDKDGNLVESKISRWDDEFQGAGQAKISADIARALREPNFKHPQRGESALVGFACMEAACRSSLNGGKVIEFPLSTGEDALAKWSRREGGK